jgi:hypothetical protein
MTYADLERKTYRRQTMFGWILKSFGGVNWLVDQLISYFLVPILKNSGKGWKFIFGCLLVILSYLADNLSGGALLPVLKQIIEIIQPYATEILDAGLVSILLSFAQRLYKLMPKP